MLTAYPLNDVVFEKYPHLEQDARHLEESRRQGRMV